MDLRLRLSVVGLCCVVTLGMFQREARAFAYVFAREGAEDIVTHPMGYTGEGGVITISIGIDPTSSFASEMVISAQNAVYTWNQLQATTGNLISAASYDIPAGYLDFETTLLHELGHALGLSHVNLASESGVPSSQRNYTKSTNGYDNLYNVNPGADGVIGSGDDIRGDDGNLNYFKTADNDPFSLSAGDVIDSTTYSRDLSRLPGDDTFSANSDRAVAELLGYANTEGVMQQGSFYDEVQRSLAADDVAGIRYAMSGVDEIQGTLDDYTLDLNYVGLDASADILIDFDNDRVGLAGAMVSGAWVGTSASGHARVQNAPIYFNSGYNWFFNDELNVGSDTQTIHFDRLPRSGLVDNFYVINPEPSRAMLLLFGCVSLLAARRRVRG